MPIAPDASLTLHYAPRTRSFTTLWALEELHLDYQLCVVDIRSGRNLEPEHLAVNPMGKVPAVVDRSFSPPVAAAETGAILTWLGDRHPERGLCPAPTDRLRADYLRWMFFSGSVIEPALGEFFFKWKVPPSSVAWGSYQRMLDTLNGALAEAEWLVGDRFTLADLCVGASARFGVNFGAMPKDGPIGAYVERLQARPAYARAMAIELKHQEPLPG